MSSNQIPNDVCSTDHPSYVQRSVEGEPSQEKTYVDNNSPLVSMPNPKRSVPTNVFTATDEDAASIQYSDSLPKYGNQTQENAVGQLSSNLSTRSPDRMKLTTETQYLNGIQTVASPAALTSGQFTSPVALTSADHNSVDANGNVILYSSPSRQGLLQPLPRPSSTPAVASGLVSYHSSPVPLSNRVSPRIQIADASVESQLVEDYGALVLRDYEQQVASREATPAPLGGVNNAMNATKGNGNGQQIPGQLNLP